MIDTAGTLCSAANILAEKGASAVYACATHGVFSANAIENINKSSLTKVVVTDSIHFSRQGEEAGKVEILSIAGLLADAIERIHEDRSVSHLFVNVEAESTIGLDLE
jgi:ribose-phosphate pyrophosphokinase